MTQTWLTQEAADRLRAELEQLEGPGRKDVTAKIEAARAEGEAGVDRAPGALRAAPGGRGGRRHPPAAPGSGVRAARRDGLRHAAARRLPQGHRNQ